MSKVRDKAKEKVAELVYRKDLNEKPDIAFEHQDKACQDVYYEWAEAILSIPELAIVDRQAQLPTGYGEGMSETAKTGYKMAQAEMQKGGWVKEEK